MARCINCGEKFDREEAEYEFNIHFNFDLNYDFECESIYAEQSPCGGGEKRSWNAA